MMFSAASWTVIVPFLLFKSFGYSIDRTSTEHKNNSKSENVLVENLRKHGLLEHYAEYKQYKKTYKKSNIDDLDEINRLSIFVNNLKIIEKHNERYRRGEVSFKMGINKFADQSPDEWKTRKGLNKGLQSSENGNHARPGIGSDLLELLLPDDNKTLPKRLDWRNHGLVTAVKDQGECGSCWAFSCTGALEGQHKRKTGKLISLSEQNLIDCSSSYGNNGCGGGLMDNAFKYVIENGGLDTEQAYPYEGFDGQCRFDNLTIGSSERSFVDLDAGDELALKRAVASFGPISVAIDATDDFVLYKEGIFSSEICSQTELNHALLLVGYGTASVKNGNGTITETQDYWLIKNSWGESWGDKGYVRIIRSENMCGIAEMASFPLI